MNEMCKGKWHTIQHKNGLLVSYSRAHFRTHDAQTQAVIQAMRAVDKRIVM